MQVLAETEELNKRLADSAEAGENGVGLMLEDMKLAPSNSTERVGPLLCPNTNTVVACTIPAQ